MAAWCWGLRGWIGCRATLSFHKFLSAQDGNSAVTAYLKVALADLLERASTAPKTVPRAQEEVGSPTQAHTHGAPPCTSFWYDGPPS